MITSFAHTKITTPRVPTQNIEREKNSNPKKKTQPQTPKCVQVHQQHYRNITFTIVFMFGIVATICLAAAAAAATSISETDTKRFGDRLYSD